LARLQQFKPGAFWGTQCSYSSDAKQVRTFEGASQRVSAVYWKQL